MPQISPMSWVIIPFCFLSFFFCFLVFSWWNYVKTYSLVSNKLEFNYKDSVFHFWGW